MKEMLTVKNKTIGKGTPLICVSVMESEVQGIVSEIERLVAQGIEMLEWRVDAFLDVENPNAVREILQTVAPIISDTIFVFTFRSKEQGGERSLSKEKLSDLHQVAAESHVVDFIDVEYFSTEDTDVKIHNLQKMGSRVIASHHNFHETPSADALNQLLEQMKHSHADIVKLAMMPNDVDDVLRLLQETNLFHKKYPAQPLITMSMGKLGVISRVSGETFGSCVTFAAGKNASAPGQIPADELQYILTALSSE